MTAPNDPANGVLLNASQHRRTFTKAYIESVNLLADMYWDNCDFPGGVGFGKKPIKDALQDIGDALKSSNGFVG